MAQSCFCPKLPAAEVERPIVMAPLVASGLCTVLGAIGVDPSSQRCSVRPTLPKALPTALTSVAPMLWWAPAGHEEWRHWKASGGCGSRALAKWGPAEAPDCRGGQDCWCSLPA
jgi:hypothetical protein